MRRPNYRKLVLATLRCKGPLTDAELAWWIRVALAKNPRTAVKKRWELTKEKKVRFARMVRITESGRVQKLWEVTPRSSRIAGDGRNDCPIGTDSVAASSRGAE